MNLDFYKYLIRLKIVQEELKQRGAEITSLTLLSWAGAISGGKGSISYEKYLTLLGLKDPITEEKRKDLIAEAHSIAEKIMKADKG